MPFVIEQETVYASVGTTSSEIIPAQNNRSYLKLQNNSASTIYVRFGDNDAAADETSIKLVSGAELTIKNPGVGAIQAIGAAAGLLTVTLQKVLLGNRNITELIAANAAYYELTDTVTLSGDFEIECQIRVLTQGSGIYAIFGGNDGEDTRLVVFGPDHPSNPNRLALYLSGATVVSASSALDGFEGKLVTITVSRVGTTVSLKVNGLTIDSNTSTDSLPMSTVGIYSDKTTNPFEDYLVNLKITDVSNLVVDAPLDGAPGANYEVNKAAVLGANDFVPSRITGNWVDNGGGVYEKTASGSGDLGEHYTDTSTVLAGEPYLLNFNISSVETLNIFTRDGGANVSVVTGLGAGSHSIIVTAGDGGGLWFARTDFVGTVSNISFREIPASTPYLIKQNIAEGDTDNYREKLDSYVSDSTTIFKA